MGDITQFWKTTGVEKDQKNVSLEVLIAVICLIWFFHQSLNIIFSIIISNTEISLAGVLNVTSLLRQLQLGTNVSYQKNTFYDKKNYHGTYGLRLYFNYTKPLRTHSLERDFKIILQINYLKDLFNFWRGLYLNTIYCDYRKQPPRGVLKSCCSDWYFENLQETLTLELTL